MSRLHQWVEEFYNFGPRRAGTKNGILFEDLIFKSFSDIGLSPIRQKINIESWECDEWEFNISGKTLPSFYIPYTTFTETQKINAPLFLLNAQTLKKNPEKIRGKIAVVDFSFPDLVGWQLKSIALSTYDPEKRIPFGKVHPATWMRPQWYLYEEAVKAGAVAFVGILNNQPGGHCTYYAPYGFREGNNILNKAIPGLWVGSRESNHLRQAAVASETADLKLRGKRYPSTTQNIIGKIPGKGTSNFILGCHHDSPFKNAVEDSSGLAALLNISEQLMKTQKLNHSTYVIATAGHFYGSIGTRQFLDKQTEIHQRTDMAIWMEHFAFSAIEKDGKLHPSNLPEPAAIFSTFNKKLVTKLAELMKKHNIHPALVLPPESPLGNYPPTDGGDFYLHGVPILNYISNPVNLLVDDDHIEYVDFKRIENFSHMMEDLLSEIDSLERADLWNKDFKIRKHLLRLSAKLASSH